MIEQLNAWLARTPGRVCLVVLKETDELKNWFPERAHINYPERMTDIPGQVNFMTDLLQKGPKSLNENVLIITQSPYIVSDFDRKSVAIYDGENVKNPCVQTFGTDVTTMLCEIFEINTFFGAIAKQKMDDIFSRIEDSTDIPALKEEMRMFGHSVDKVLLFHTLLDREKKLQQKGGSHD